MFQYMRDHPHPDDTVAVYGLDSDLIMLSLFHFELFNNIFIFREAPEFMKSSIPIISNEKNKNEPYFINTKLLSISIVDEMDCSYKKKSQIYDYIFLCFFLGNDFLPHFPAINIRTTGIQFLLDIYRKYIGRFPNRTLVSHATKQIEWKWVSVFVQEMAKNEKYLVLDDFVSREKYNHWKWKETTEKEKEEKINSLPIIYRTVENYIYPKEPYWEERYYMALFQHPQVVRSCEPQIQGLCNNYMEGLEWVYRYYTVGCPDWRWKYKYHYPPLLCDLQKYIPHFQMNFINGEYPDNRPFSPHVQLAYVLPKKQMVLLMPYSKQREYLLKSHGELYPETFDFMWAFKRYLYESSCMLPEISMEVLQQWEKELVVV
jgi:5'-3' exonuclease